MRNRSFFHRIAVIENRAVNSREIHLGLKHYDETGELPEHPKIREAVVRITQFAIEVDELHSMPFGYWEICRKDPEAGLHGDPDRKIQGLQSLLGEKAPTIDAIRADLHLERPPEWFLDFFSEKNFSN